MNLYVNSPYTSTGSPFLYVGPKRDRFAASKAAPPNIGEEQTVVASITLPSLLNLM
jgi:hypothetical protein